MALARKADPRYDLPGLIGTLIFHGLLALMLVLRPAQPERRRTIVEVDFKKKAPPPVPEQPQPPPPPPPPPPPVEPPRKLARQPRPAETPRPSPTPPTEPPKPVAPVFGISPDQTVANGTGVAVQTGNTTLADPSKRPKGPVEPLPPAAGAPGKEFRPVAEEDLRALPEQEGGNPDICVAGLKEKYVRSEAAAAGLEGEVSFRIELDETGKIRSIKPTKRIGGGVDEMAMGWLRFNPRCKFKPAIARDGKPVAFVIDRYSITFLLDR